MLERTRVDDHRHVVLEREVELILGVVATAGTDDPGLHPAGTGDDLGSPVDDP